jgi:cell division protein FtsZ
LRPVAPAPAKAPAKKEGEQAKQETLPLEGVTRGRFDKSEPTLYDGEDLDVPTYLRRGVSLKR